MADAHQSVASAPQRQGLRLEQAEGPEDEPPEEAAAERAPWADEPTEENLSRAEAEPDPEVRTRAYDAGRRELQRVDPHSPAARPELRSPDWRASPADIARGRGALADATTAKSLGIAPERYRDPARDPARGGHVM